MRTLPPLNPIKAFEAAARLGSFVEAANELGVTSAAISLQVKKAEAYFGKQLFVRQNNSIILTDAGHMLFQPVSKSLFDLSALTASMLENEVPAQCVISTIQSISDKWVAPALKATRDKFPNLGVNLIIEDDPVDMLHRQVDLRLTYGGQHYPKSDTQTIATDRVKPLCSPEFAKNHANGLETVRDSAFIHIDWGAAYASYPNWSGWFDAAGFGRAPDIRKGVRVAGTAVAVALAESGGGVVLAPVGLSARQIKSGTLVALSASTQALPFDFVAVRNARYMTSVISPMREQFLEYFIGQLTGIARSSIGI